MRPTRLLWALLCLLLPFVAIGQGPLTKSVADKNYAAKYPVSASDIARTVLTVVANNDTFTGSAGTLLSAHTMDSGQSWARTSVGTSGGSNMVLVAGNLVRQDAVTGFTVYNAPAQTCPDYELNFGIKRWTTNSTQMWPMARRVEDGNGYYYVLKYGATANQFDLVRALNGTNTTLGSYALTLVDGQTCTVRWIVSGASQIVYINGTARITVYDTRLSLPGRPALGIFDGFLATDTTRLHYAGPFTVTSTVAAGAPYQTGAGYGTIAMGSQAASGGTVTAYQWYRSSTRGTKGSAVSGAVSAVLSDSGLTPNTLYYYTKEAVINGITVSSQQVAAATLHLPVTGVVGAGDSRLKGYGTTNYPTKNPIYVTRSQLAQAYGVSTSAIGYYNGAFEGTTTADWATSAGGTPTNGADLVGTCTAALATSPPCNVMVLCVGTNDSKSASLVSVATYKANLTTICNYAVSRGFTVIVCAPGSITPEWYYQGMALWDSTSVAQLALYRDAIKSICNGSTILLGDVDYFGYSVRNPQGQPDGIHENDAMTVSWANYITAAIRRNMDGGLRVASLPSTSTELVALSALRRSDYDLRGLNALVAIDERRRLALR